MRRVFLACGLIPWLLLSQTQIDLANQTMPLSRNLKSGLAFPTACRLGDVFVKTDAAAGQSLYVCGSANDWKYQGGLVSIFSDGVEIGARSVQNFAVGQGIIQAFSDTPTRLNLVTAVDTAVIQTRTNAQSGQDLLCESTGGFATAYTCLMTPVLQSYRVGMVFHWIPDVSMTGESATLSINTLAAIPIKLHDGTTNPAPGDISAGRLYKVWYDGTNFRILWRNVPADSLQVERNTQAGRELRCNSSSASPITYTCGLSPALTAYTAGMVLRWLPDVNNGAGALTLNVNNLGAKAVKQQDGVRNLAADDLVAGRLYEVWYDGTNFRMLSPVAIPTESATRPTCDATMRGSLWFQPGSGIKDELSVCAADESAAYEWRILY